MAYCSLFEGVIFVEGKCEYIQYKGEVEYKKDSFYNQQLKNLDTVKHQLAEKAKTLGANAIIDFKYGQKNTSFLRSLLLSFDDNIKWYGTGVAVILSKEKVDEILSKIECVK